MAYQSVREPAPEGSTRLAMVARARADVFCQLTTAFFDPTRDLVEQLADGSFSASFITSFQDLMNRDISAEAVFHAVRPLRSFQTTLSRGAEDDLLHELNREYTRLFIGPGRAVVPPYETFYNPKATESPLLMVSREAKAVESAYREAGVAVAGDLREPADHFATECEFIYYLAQKEADSWSEDNAANALAWRRRQLAFLETHLGRWGGQFCHRVLSESSHPFYQSCAHLGKYIVELEGCDSAHSPNKPDLGKPG